MQETLERSETKQTQEKPPTWSELYDRARRLANVKLWSYRKKASENEFTGAVLDSLADLREVFDAESILEGGLTKSEVGSSAIEGSSNYSVGLIEEIKRTEYNEPAKDYKIDEIYDECIDRSSNYKSSSRHNKIYNGY